jgi:hypothetical protein
MTSSQIEKKLLHYTGKAIADYKMIKTGDNVMVCLSGGKDSFTLLTLLKKLQKRARSKFKIFAFTLDQAQPGWDDSALRQWLSDRDISFEILKRDTYYRRNQLHAAQIIKRQQTTYRHSTTRLLPRTRHHRICQRTTIPHHPMQSLRLTRKLSARAYAQTRRRISQRKS